MTPREEFKAAFLLRCAQDGLTLEQMALRAKEAADQMEKAAGVGDVASGIKNLFAPALGIGGGAYLGDKLNAPTTGAAAGLALGTEGGRALLGGLGSAALPLLIGAPIAAGGLAGYGLSKMTDVSDDDVNAVKDKELLDTYKQETNRLDRQKAVRDFARMRADTSRFRQP